MPLESTMRKAKAEKKKKKKKREEEKDEGNITIPITTSNKKKKEKEKKQYKENIVGGEPNSDKVKKKNRVGEDVISWKEEGEEEEEEVLDYLPGQKHDRPGKRDPLRIFYETLYQKAPDCELAETWMMEWGLLPPNIAEKVYETKFGHNQQMSPGAVKAASTSEVPSRKESKRLSNSALKTKKRKSSETNSVDDLRPPKKKKIKKQVFSST